MLKILLVFLLTYDVTVMQESVNINIMSKSSGHIFGKQSSEMSVEAQVITRELSASRYVIGQFYPTIGSHSKPQEGRCGLCDNLFKNVSWGGCDDGPKLTSVQLSTFSLFIPEKTHFHLLFLIG